MRSVCLVIEGLVILAFKAYYLCKMIPAEIWYKTQNGELLVIVEVFKSWWHDLENYKYKILILIKHNSLCRFINTKNLSFCQV